MQEDGILFLCLCVCMCVCYASAITEQAFLRSFVGNSSGHHVQGRIKGSREKTRQNYNRVGNGVGDSCSFGAYLAKKGKKTVSMTPTIASM